MQTFVISRVATDGRLVDEVAPLGDEPRPSAENEAASSPDEALLSDLTERASVESFGHPSSDGRSRNGLTNDGERDAYRGSEDGSSNVAPTDQSGGVGVVDEVAVGVEVGVFLLTAGVGLGEAAKLES